MKKFFAGLAIFAAIMSFLPGLKYYVDGNADITAGLNKTIPAFSSTDGEIEPVTDAEAGAAAKKEEPAAGEVNPTPTPAESAPSPSPTASPSSFPAESAAPAVSPSPAPSESPAPSREQNNDNEDSSDRQDIKIVNLNQVYTYEVMTRDIKGLAEAYPGLIEYKSLGTTGYNREIWAVKLGKGKPNVFINGSHHAREWSTTGISMYMLDRYANAYMNNDTFEEYDTRDILDKISIWFVPMVNPDGVTLQQKGIQAFPEEARGRLLELNKGSLDFGEWKANADGIDLNRQYPADWENIENNSPAPSYQNYKGTAPLTAFEAKTIADFTYGIDPEITLSYHDSGRILFWHFHNKPEVLSRDKRIAGEFSKLTGYALVPPSPNPSGGGYKDWFIQEFGRPGFTAEIGEYANNRSIPVSRLPAEWERNKKAGLFIANEGFKLWIARSR